MIRIKRGRRFGVCKPIGPLSVLLRSAGCAARVREADLDHQASAILTVAEQQLAPVALANPVHDGQTEPGSRLGPTA